MLLLWILIVNCILSIIYIVSGHKRTQSTIIKLRVERKNGTFIIWQQMIAYIHCPLLLWQFDGIDRANNMIRVPLLCKLQYILFFQRKLSIRKNLFWRGIKSESFLISVHGWVYAINPWIKDSKHCYKIFPLIVRSAANELQL